MIGIEIRIIMILEEIRNHTHQAISILTMNIVIAMVMRVFVTVLTGVKV